tara:strand:- start:2257 stop:2961 length:705 start_codon:yes stop_codon:yes gene_type:complete
MDIEKKVFLNVDFCFYHVERSGGTSIRRALFRFFSKIYDRKEIFYPEKLGNRNLTKRDYDELQKKNIVDFKKIKVILSHIEVKFFEINSKQSLINLRNPIDRAFSHYYHFRFPKSNLKIEELSKEEFFEIFNYLGKTLCLRSLPSELSSLNNEEETCKYIEGKFNNIIRFDFINKDYNRLIRKLSDFYGINFKENLNKFNETKNYSVDLKVKKKLEKFNLLDSRLYNLFMLRFK